MKQSWMSHAHALPELRDAERQQTRRRSPSESDINALADADGNTNPSAVSAFQPAVAERTVKAEEAAVAETTAKSEPSAIASAQPAGADNMVT